MATEFASLKMEIDATDTVKATAALDKLSQQGTKTEKAMLGLSSAAKSLGIALSTVGIASFIKSGIDSLDMLNDLSLKTGIAAEKLAGFRLAARQSGTSIDTFAHAINLLSVNMANNSKKFQQLGVDAKVPEQAFIQMVSVLERVKDQQTKAAIAQQAFGRSWQELAPLIAMGSVELQKSIDKGSALSKVTKENTQAADAFNDQLEIMSTWLGGLSIYIIGPVISTFNELADNLRNTTSEAVTFLNVMKGISDFAMNRKSLSGAQSEFNSLQEQISAQEQRIKGLTSLNKAGAGGGGYNISAEVKKLNDLYAAQDVVINKIGESTKQLGNETQKALNPVYVSDFIGTTEKASKASSNHAGSIRQSHQAVKELTTAYEELGPSSDLYYESLEKQKDALASIEDQYLRLTLSAKDYYSLSLSKQGIAPEAQGPMLQKFDQVAQIEKQKAASESVNDYIKSITNAQTELQNLGDIAGSIFDSQLSGLDQVIGAYDKMTNSLININAQLVENTKQKQLNEDAGNTPEQAKNRLILLNKELSLNDELISEKVSGYRRISSALSSSLKKGSDEQKAAHAISVGLATIELAMQLKKILGIGAVTAAEAASVAPTIAATTAKTGVKAVEAITTQGSAGPFIGFALMAAMAAALAAIGAFKGKTMPAPSTATGTGTVLGDTAAQSESVDKTYKLLKDIHAEEYAELRGINKGVQNLAGAIAGTITKLFQGGGLQEISVGGLGKKISGLGSLIENPITEALGTFLKKIPVVGGIINSISNFVFGSTKKSITGAGIQVGKVRVEDILNGAGIDASQYTIIKTEKKGFLGGLFGGNSTKYKTKYSPLTSEVTDALNQVFQASTSVMLDIAKSLGGELSSQVKNYVIQPFKVELKGLSGEEASKKLNAVISSTLDKMSSDVFGKIIGQYQQLGEGMLETAIRIVSEVAIVREALARSGGKLGDNAIKIADSLIQAAGGITEFQSQFEAYYDKFFSDSEKQRQTQINLIRTLREYDLILPKTRDNYRKLIEGLNLSNAKDRERYSLLIGLSKKADDYYSVLEEKEKARLDAEKKRIDAEKRKFEEAERARIAAEKARIAAEKKRRDDEIARIKDIQKVWKNLTDSIANEISKIRGTMREGSTQATFDYFATIALKARKGNKASAELLPTAAENYLKLASETATNALELAKIQAKVIDILEKTKNSINTNIVPKTPKFADGGYHQGGFRIVGESGPELEYTGPSRIFSANDTAMLDNRPLISEIRALRQEVSSMRMATESTAQSSRKTSDLLRNVTQDGQSLMTTAV